MQVHDAGMKYASSTRASASKLSKVEIRVEGYCLPVAMITPLGFTFSGILGQQMI